MPTIPNYTVAEINLTNLLENYRLIRQRVAPAEVMAVIKANAYGHGAVVVGKTLAAAGAKYFAVARLSEALELIESGLNGTILLFGSLFPDEMEIALKYGCRITITCPEDIHLVKQIAGRLDMTAQVHIKVDTGMGRVGLLWDSALEHIKTVSTQPELFIEGIYTHFATADMRDKSYVHIQLQRFQQLLTAIEQAGIRVPYYHAANSGAILDLPEAYFNMVRPGIALYGHYPTTDTTESLPLRPVMTLRTVVAQVRKLPAGVSISYGQRYFTRHETAIAVLPIGYADGVFRSFSNTGKVMIKGKFYPIVGTVTMDQIMVEIGEDNVQVGDKAFFWGETPDGTISATQVAAQIGTIAYELCCAVSRRVPRIYLNK